VLCFFEENVDVFFWKWFWLVFLKVQLIKSVTS